MKVATIVLAAGIGKRMKSNLTKVLHPIAGRPMILYTVDLARRITEKGIIVVLGHQTEKIKEVLTGEDLKFAIQKKPLGTGDAVKEALRLIEDYSGTVLVLNGDTPLLREETLNRLLQTHQKEKTKVTLLTAEFDNPTGYGRVLRGRRNKILRIVEEKDLKKNEKDIREINSGTYAFDSKFLFEAIKGINRNNAQREYYLTDTIEIATKKGIKVSSVSAEDHEEVLGINTRINLAKAESIARRRILDAFMLQGVTIISPESTFIDSTVSIGRDTIIYPNTYIEGNTVIGEECRIFPNTRISNSTLGDMVTIKDSCVITDSRIEDRATVGPFTHLRPGCTLSPEAKVGNFVEVKNTKIGKGSKAMHLSYLGDAVIGEGVNIGAGTITCNYDGIRKYQTIIEDDVFVGSDTQFVAPVKVGKGALIGAGSTITEDVPADALALSRVKQVTKEGWARKRKRQESRRS